MIRTIIYYLVMLLSFVLLGGARTRRLIKEVEDGYADEIDRLRSHEVKMRFENADLEAENYWIKKALRVDDLDIAIRELGEKVKNASN